tara:strand:- start:347 stop:748 length:402 start_codon:yes stop_codon:yes gene_type:complete
MLKKGYKIYSILFGKCPRCHQDNMYEEKNPYIISSTLKLNENCSSCNLYYHIEPSFFTGSMYVSYGVGIAFAVAAFIISHFIFEATLLKTFFAITGTLILFMPIIARLSRSIWINLFISYDKDAIKKYGNKED